MASASKRYRVIVAARGHSERWCAERTGLSERGEIELRYGKGRTPAGEFTPNEARTLRRRLRKWWAIVQLEAVP